MKRKLTIVALAALAAAALAAVAFGSDAGSSARAIAAIAKGTGITFVTADQQGDMGRMAARLDIGEDFEESGMKVAPPRVVFSASRGGRRSGLRAPKRRRF